MKKIIGIVILALLLIGAIWINYPTKAIPSTQPINVGSFTPVGGSTFYLSGSGITSTASSIQLTSFQTPDGRSLNMSMFGSIGYGVLEPGTSKMEDITFTGITQNSNGTAILTGVSRGMDFVTPYAATPSLGFAHAGGSQFALSNTAGFYGQQFGLLNNAQTWSAINTFSASPIVPTPTTSSQAATKGYADSLSYAGAPNGNFSTKGIFQLATGLQAASSTVTGSTGANLVLPSSIATDTPSVGTSGSDVVMSDILGYVWKNVVANLGLANTFTATTTFTGPVVTPEVTLATSTTMTVNFGSGNRQLIRKGTVGMAVSFANYVAGESLALTICNPGTSGGALTFSGVLWPGATPPTLTTTANKCDIVTLNATNATSTPVLLGGFNLNY